MNSTSSAPDVAPPSGQAQPQVPSHRRTRRFFRRAAAAAAVACALAAGVEFWPIAYDVARFSDLSANAAAETGGWSGVSVFLLAVVVGAAALAAALAVLTVGWWVQLRISQSHRRLRLSHPAAQPAAAPEARAEERAAGDDRHVAPRRRPADEAPAAREDGPAASSERDELNPARIRRRRRGAEDELQTPPPAPKARALP